MAKRKRKDKDVLQLTENERREVELMIDRLRLQDPNGQSLANCLKTLRQVLGDRQRVAAALLDDLSRRDNGVCFRAFCELRSVVTDKKLAKVVRQAEYRLRQKGYPLPEETQNVSDASAPVTLIRQEVRKEECHLVTPPVGAGLWQYSAYLPIKGEADFLMVVLAVTAPFEGQMFHASFQSRKKYRELLRGSAEHLDAQPHPVPVAHMAQVFFELERLGRLDTLKRDQILLARQALSPHGIGTGSFGSHVFWREKLPVDPGYDPEFLADVAVGEVSWVVPLFQDSQALKTAAMELETARRSVLVVPDHVKAAQEREIVATAARAVFDARVRDILTAHYLETSLARHLTGDDEGAALFLALSEHMQSLKDPGESPVTARLTAWALQVLHGVSTSLAEEPDDEEKEPEAEHGGLILPR